MLTDAERRTLEGWARRRKTAQGLAQRARIVLLCAEGKSNIAVAAELGITRITAGKWRNRFVTARFAGLSDEPRPGVPRTITDAQIEEVVVRTLEEVPEGATHWSKRELARQTGLSPTTIHRIWRAFGLKPWLVEEFKLSTDPFLINKVRDIVGLYLAPPANAAVFSVDEKPQIQALERTAPVLPMVPGTPERRSHDYERHGTADLFAALNIATGKVTGKTSARHAARGLQRLPRPDRPHRRARPGSPPDLRQPLRAQGPCGQAVAAGTPALRAALHPGVLIVAEPGGAVVRRTAAPPAGPRCLLLHR